MTTPTPRQLSELEHARQIREADAVLVAMYVANGEQVPEHVIAKFRVSNADFHLALEAIRP